MSKPKRPTRGAIRRTPEVEGLFQDDLVDFEGYLWPNEGAILALLASQVPADQVIVELGSFKGKSACYLARGAKAGDGAKVHCVDVWEASDQEFARHYERAEIFSEPSVFETFEAQTAKAKVKSLITTHHARTVDVAQDWTKPVGLLFVDADHHYDACSADTIAWAPHVVGGGWIAWHDYGNHRFPGVDTFVDEWLPGWDPYQVIRRGNLVAAQLRDDHDWTAGEKVSDDVDDAQGALELG